MKVLPFIRSDRSEIFERKEETMTERKQSTTSNDDINTERKQSTIISEKNSVDFSDDTQEHPVIPETISYDTSLYYENAEKQTADKTEKTDFQQAGILCYVINI